MLGPAYRKGVGRAGVQGLFYFPKTIEPARWKGGFRDQGWGVRGPRVMSDE